MRVKDIKIMGFGNGGKCQYVIGIMMLLDLIRLCEVYGNAIAVEYLKKGGRFYSEYGL